MQCEVCGAKEAIFKANIEGTVLTCCQKCSKLGKQVSNIQQKNIVLKKSITKEEPAEEVIEDYGHYIKTAREKCGLSQSEISEKINERESLIQRIESEKALPSIALAKKLERFLGIKLVEIVQASKVNLASDKPFSLTIGDSVRVRKR
ncbi:MAG: multiprotein bridging factor aMBF1 [Nanoarchaeota archaeon]